MNLFKASRQWAERPSDERFSNLQEMYDTCKGYADTAAEAKVAHDDLRVEAVDGEIQLVGKSGHPARFTNWGFGQLCSRAGAPAQYLNRLPATLAAQNLNHGLKLLSQKADNPAASDAAYLLFHRDNGTLILRAFTSQWYSRIWNWQVVEQLMQLPQGWRVPPARPARADQPGARPATAADILTDRDGGGGLSVNIGDMIAPAGLYASDHDMFGFLVNESLRIADGSDQGLSRGFFVENSEVGASAFKLTTFLYRHVCGNHIVWGAKDVNQVRIVHVGDKAIGKSWRQLQATVSDYAETSARDDEQKIARAQTLRLGDGKEDVVEKLFKLHITSRKNFEAAYDTTDSLDGVDGDPRTAWGIANGLTRLSQQAAYADARTELDRAAGRVLEISF
jgi:hypothetical protein